MSWRVFFPIVIIAFKPVKANIIIIIIISDDVYVVHQGGKDLRLGRSVCDPCF